MAIGSFSVNPAQVEALANNIRHGADGIQAQLDELDAKVNQLRQSWDGAAQQAYTQAQAKWTADLNDVRNILNQIASATSQISSSYTASDHKAAGFFG